MRQIKKSVVLTIFSLLLVAPWLNAVAQGAQEPPAEKKEEKTLSLDSLLEEVKQGRQEEAKINARRIAEFRREKSKQQQRLNDLKAEQQREEQISEEREKTFEDNELLITDLHRLMNERLGELKELFGVLQQVSSDALGQFYASLTQLRYPDRIEFLGDFSDKMGQTTELPSISEIERLWFELQREMTESGKVVRRVQPVINRDGEELQKEVVRVGTFNIVSDGKYLQFVPETGRIIEYGRQPSARYLNGAEDISEPGTGTVEFTVDPTRGQLLSLLVASPDLSERVAQGGVIGYVILSLGAIAFIVAIVRLGILTVLNGKVNQQIAQPSVIGNNPLGRILDEYQSHKERDLETLELKMGEAVMREVPKINRGLAFLKIIAAVAPLLGLLGTVTGMIITFQAIVLYGAGDPKMMAGGISQALVTTVQGLTVAIPTLLLHNLVQTRARHITEVLEQEAVAIVANQAEKQNSTAGN